MTILGSSLYQWAGLILILVVSLVASRVVFWRLSKSIRLMSQDPDSNLLDRLMTSLEQPLFVLSMLCGIWLGMGVLSLEQQWRDLFISIWQLLFTCTVTWVVVRLYDYAHDFYIIPRLGARLGEEFLSALKGVIKSIIWALGILLALNNAGYDVTTILASLGILGLAVALAAQDTVANLFGGVAIFTQQPFKIGERIKVADVDGWIKRVGFRNTIIVDIYGQEIIVPNRYFSENPVRNISSRSAYIVSGLIPLSQAVHPATAEEFMDFLRDLLRTHPDLNGNGYVGIKGFGKTSIDVEFWFEVKKRAASEHNLYADEYAKIVVVRSDIYLRAIQQMRTLGLEPAFSLLEMPEKR